jgi:hypothetical protein
MKSEVEDEKMKEKIYEYDKNKILEKWKEVIRWMDDKKIEEKEEFE